MVADLWAKPWHQEPAERVSQLLAGAPVLEVERREGFVCVEGPDRYRGWMKEEDLAPYRSPKGEVRVIGLPYAFLYDAPDSPWPRETTYMGTQVEVCGTLHGRCRVLLPNGTWFVPAPCLRPVKAANDPVDLPTLLQDARRFLGVPYLWGGGTARGVDCSGLVQLLFRMQGRVLCRDSHQQVRHGTPVELDAVQPGDLLFFGRSERGLPTHVGLALSKEEYIHAQGGAVGRVHISRLEEAIVAGRLWGARRIH